MIFHGKDKVKIIILVCWSTAPPRTLDSKYPDPAATLASEQQSVAEVNPVLMTLLGPCNRHGLAARNNTAPDVLEQLSRDLVEPGQQPGQIAAAKLAG